MEMARYAQVFLLIFPNPNNQFGIALLLIILECLQFFPVLPALYETFDKLIKKP